MTETERLDDNTAADQQERVRRFQDAAAELATKSERPTVEEVEASLKLAKELPGPDFGEWFEIEKERNTERYQEAEKETRRMLGIRNTSRTKRRLLRDILLGVARKTY